ncbi:beta-ketoacyl-[acyl-carrier-protein] synthase family protein [Anaerocolumna sp. AGMB13020]|uniref:beta-ketoacyl-[acyl-carrier-protein] synthase family protein n=1 Tax=Anaerocolumna sp. AGMB13020 TaxID=3081750 RepID=UPI0029543745|nr:beta-ketoacyl-[acyl-carrier-protein] synthase family protein [Anaerocolumna sp. AGMB13020]WOO38571.1 beta-ketoacyl-[acyl-carrier-protein] synthase family protein [Anaerocolumna sp. AGMB13020]
MSTEKRVVVTGISVMAANGNNIDEFNENAVRGIGGIKKTTLFPTDKIRTDYFGQVNKTYIYEVQSLKDKSRLECMYEDLILQLLEDTSITPEIIGELNEKVGFSFATSVGVNDYVSGHVKGSIEKSISKSNIYKLPKKLKIKGPVFVNTSACAAGTTAIGTAYSLVNSGICDMVISGGIDPLTEFSSYGFHSLQNLSSTPCRPFDKDRDGITLGEGGALFVIESYESAQKRNAKIYCEVLGYGLGNDAYHATSPDPSGDGAYRVMTQALKQADVLPAKIDYINTHGTGTEINDSMEIKAIERLTGKCHVNSIKSQVGHCLAAAGAVEFAATVLSINNSYVYPNINLSNPINSLEEVELPSELVYKNIHYALSNSFAFAGNAASIVVGGISE